MTDKKHFATCGGYNSGYTNFKQRLCQSQLGGGLLHEKASRRTIVISGVVGGIDRSLRALCCWNTLCCSGGRPMDGSVLLHLRRGPATGLDWLVWWRDRWAVCGRSRVTIEGTIVYDWFIRQRNVQSKRIFSECTRENCGCVTVKNRVRDSEKTRDILLYQVSFIAAKNMRCDRNEPF